MKEAFEKDGINLQNLVYKINDHLEARNLKGKFAAFTLGIFDTISGDIYFCNAGDNIINIYDSVAKKLKTITLPASLKVFAPIPNKKPSGRYSIALLDKLLANPVIGTTVPALAI